MILKIFLSTFGENKNGITLSGFNQIYHGMKCSTLSGKNSNQENYYILKRFVDTWRFNV